jgi:hypothetical protein
VRLGGAADDVATTEDAYREKGAMAKLFEIASTPGVGDWVDAGEMENLYSGTLARLGSPVRHIYDTLRSAARHNLCPFCAQRAVGTLDHYLPKTTHPALAITPLNLLPCCADCNKSKLTHLATVAEDQLLHPYFDDADSEIWLTASVMEVSPPAIQFSVARPQNWSELMYMRVLKHFRVLGLGSLYASHAGEELENLRYKLKRLRQSAGAQAVKQHLNEEEMSRRQVNRNSWQAALYAGLAASDWFCDEGVGHV